MEALPLIDLRPLRDGSDPHAVAGALDAACTDLGFFVVTGHGLDPDLRAATMEQARRFFALPFEEKMEIAIAKSPCHSGYVPPKTETLDPTVGADGKEAFDITTDRAADHPEVIAGTPLHGPAQWPASLMPDFKSVADEYAKACLDINAHLMRGLALALGLDADAFVSMFTDPLGSLRMLHYPPVPVGDTALGIAPHTDYGSLTLLAQDDIGGLQVAARGGGWIDVVTPPDALIVNLGDMIARWTNHRYVSTRHRVLNPTHGHRYSLPYFVTPDYNAVIEAIPTCVEPGAEPIHPPIGAGEYLQSRFEATHAYLGAPTDGQIDKHTVLVSK
ncbi:isopenicillin N synthase [Rhodococcus rhodochrous]|uniref:isopenicillin N synthase family dioxygenase n=1 Tax=Rhodococcus rhodochrous TaxID=1829 RepID=UPI0007512DF2|nr:2-oxoglutarate and iron-dependent oxygenase domain-containing protein [Rhodococcus rhodochrous]MDO1484785.1 isopenicillin N synthase family oxygenase [Rhodococcus rhodochrous]SNV15151.1 isopenicillin N synthase [Rhodococcus rhodochrous]